MAPVNENQFRVLVVCAVALAGLIAYSNTWGSEFVWDDASSILLHEHVKDPSKFLQLFAEDQHAFGRGQGNFYRPLVAASFMVDYALSRPPGSEPVGPAGVPQPSPFLFHVTNLAWHVLCSLMFFALLTRLDAPRFVRIAAPLIYVVHPLNTEAVTYISGRADPMSGAFVFASLFFAIADGDVAKRRNGTIASAACFALGMLCKESTLIVPFLLLFIIYAGRRMRASADAAPLYNPPYAALAASGVLLGVYAVLRMTALRFAPPQTAGTETGLATRIVEAMQSFALYIKLLFVPTGLHMERTLDGVPTWIGLVGFGLLVLCVATAVLAFRKGHHRIAMAAGLFLITWFPISGLIPLNAPMAEHWLYVPMAGFWWGLFELVWTAVGPSRARYALYTLVYAACAVFVALTVQRNIDWRNNEALYSATLEKSPHSVRVRYNLAVTYEDLLGNLPAARREYEKVLDHYKKKKEAQQSDAEHEQFWQDEIESHLSLGGIFLREEQYDKAAAHYTTLLRLELNDDNAPVIAASLIGMAQAMTNTGRSADAEKLLDEGIQRIPQLKDQLEEAKQRILGIGLTG